MVHTFIFDLSAGIMSLSAYLLGVWPAKVLVLLVIIQAIFATVEL
jgi:hypothetical protein